MTPFQLPLARFRFRLRAESPLQFPDYAGSTWRGAFGTALKRAVCVTHEPTCKGCLLARSCVYSQVFETPAGKEPLLEKGTDAPHPYVLQPLDTSGAHYARGTELVVGMTLIGDALAHLPYLVHTFRLMGERGVGKGDGRFALVALEQESAPGAADWAVVYVPGGELRALPVGELVIPALTGDVRVTLCTPYRGLRGGRVIRNGCFGFSPFMGSLLRRVSLLQTHHTGVSLKADFRELTRQAEAVAVRDVQTQWYDWARYSNRQHTKVPMGGLVGSFVLPAQGLEPFWPWLWLGQWLHVGKGAVMGLGEYRLEPNH